MSHLMLATLLLTLLPVIVFGILHPASMKNTVGLTSERIAMSQFARVHVAILFFLVVVGLASAAHAQLVNATEEWCDLYDGPDGALDTAIAVGVDAGGNVYVAGSSFETSPFVEREFATLKIDQNGNRSTAWPDVGFGIGVRRYDGNGCSTASANDTVRAMAVDPSGQAYVTGSSFSCTVSPFQGCTDFASSWYDPNGNVLRPLNYDGTVIRCDEPSDIAVDAQGTVYVTGDSGVPGFHDDIATLKYDANGSLSSTWPNLGSGTGIRRYDRLSGDDRAVAIALDDAGNVYVTGRSMGGGGTSWDIITLKYDQSGNLSGTWPDQGLGVGVRRYDGAASDNDQPADIVYHAGSLYVTGFTSVGGGFSARDYVTIKYNASNGSEDWVRLYDGEGGSDSALAVAVDDAGSVYVTGRIDPDGSFSGIDDIATLKYEANGDLSASWPNLGAGIGVRRFRSLTNGDDQPAALALDRDGNVYITGESAGSIITLRYNQATGTRPWAILGDPGKGNDIFVDAPGNVYVVGESNSDFITLKYSQESIAHGDMNGDGVNDPADIDPFVRALLDPVLFAETDPLTDINRADMNQDGLINGDDIDPFVAEILADPSGACCNPMDWTCTETSPGNCLAMGFVYEGDGSLCDGGACPFEYRNDPTEVIFFAPGANVEVADDLTLGGTARALIYYDLAVAGLGGAPFSATASLYTDCPGNDGALIPGTTSTWNGIPNDGTIFILSFSPNSVVIPGTVWMGISFTDNNAVWMIGGQAEIGSTADLMGVNQPPWACNQFFGGNPHAGFRASIQCVPVN